VWISTDCL